MSYHTRSVNSPTVKRDLQKYCFTPSPHQRMAFSNFIRSPKLHNPINDMLKKIVKKILITEHRKISLRNSGGTPSNDTYPYNLTNAHRKKKRLKRPLALRKFKRRRKITDGIVTGPTELNPSKVIKVNTDLNELSDTPPRYKKNLFRFDNHKQVNLKKTVISKNVHNRSTMDPPDKIRGIAHRKRTGDDYRFMVTSPTQNIKRPKLKHSNTKVFRYEGQDTLTKDLLSPNCTSPANFSKNSDYKRSNCKNLDEISSPNSSISNENKDIFTTKRQGFEPQILSL